MTSTYVGLKKQKNKVVHKERIQLFGTVHQYGHHFIARKNYAIVEIYLN